MMRHLWKGGLVGLVVAAVAPSLGLAGEKIIHPSEQSQIYDGRRWHDHGQTYELFGVDTCPRGLLLRSATDKNMDCGALATARLAAFFATAKIACKIVAETGTNEVPVVCTAEIGDHTLDLGLAMVSTGYAFASLAADGRPVIQNYLVAELSAKIGKHGLWAFGSMDHSKFDNKVPHNAKQ
jgi:endonuclease YncB( thermonuclease family)